MKQAAGSAGLSHAPVPVCVHTSEAKVYYRWVALAYMNIMTFVRIYAHCTGMCYKDAIDGESVT